MSGNGITGIGYPLGNIGLNATGTYGSYDAYMPSYLGTNGYGAYGTAGLGSSIFNGAGMYNPLFMGNVYQQMQQQMEASQLTHAGRMHAGVYANEVAAHRTTDSALIEKILTNSDIQQGVVNLHAKVCAGEQEGICQEFDKLKDYILTTYRDELAARGDKINVSSSATEIIERVYGSLISAKQGGTVANLRDDILRNCDKAFTNGFYKGFKKGHHDKYVDETMMHCFGLRIDEKKSKDAHQELGQWVGTAANVGKWSLYGAGAFAGVGTVGLGVLKGFTPDPEKVIDKKVAKKIAELNEKGTPTPAQVATTTNDATTAAKKTLRYRAGNWAKNLSWFKTMKNWGKVGLIAGTIAGIWWQFSEA